MGYDLYATPCTADFNEPVPGVTYTDYHAFNEDAQEVVYIGTRCSDGVWRDCEPGGLNRQQAVKVGEIEGEVVEGAAN